MVQDVNGYVVRFLIQPQVRVAGGIDPHPVLQHTLIFGALIHLLLVDRRHRLRPLFYNNEHIRRRKPEVLPVRRIGVKKFCHAHGEATVQRQFVIFVLPDDRPPTRGESGREAIIESGLLFVLNVRRRWRRLVKGDEEYPQRETDTSRPNRYDNYRFYMFFL